MLSFLIPERVNCVYIAIPTIQKFRYLVCAYGIQNRSAWVRCIDILQPVSPAYSYHLGFPITTLNRCAFPPISLFIFTHISSSSSPIRQPISPHAHAHTHSRYPPFLSPSRAAPEQPSPPETNCHTLIYRRPFEPDEEANHQPDHYFHTTSPSDRNSPSYYKALRTCAVDIALIDKMTENQATW